jgi:uncharacterized membrane protein YphA (DoxX/SURF4 family)
MIHARFCNSAADLAAAYVEHFAHHGWLVVHGARPRESRRLPAPTEPCTPYAVFSLNPGIQGLLELVGGLLLALGLFTRPVAFILAGNMAVAYFMAHAPRGFIQVTGDCL